MPSSAKSSVEESSLIEMPASSAIMLKTSSTGAEGGTLMVAIEG